MQRLNFHLEALAPDSHARAGRLETAHGTVETPVFMPVGTRATVRTQRPDELWATGARILLANTFHLLERPGPEVFQAMGGIQRFMHWPGAVLTDSGGFQVFSLAQHLSINEKGATFRMHPDKAPIVLTPERSITMQQAIGSDIAMAFDQCVPSTVPFEEAKAAVERTGRWAQRCIEARGDHPQALFGIVQGALYPELRRLSAEAITALPFDGFALGGLAVGESREERRDMTAFTAALLPHDRPRYLMGVGTPVDLLEAIHRGVDMFDCIIPSAHASQGVVYTFEGIRHLRRSAYTLDEAVLEPGCPCRTCQRYSRAYLHHLIMTKEVLGWELITDHNLTFYQRLTRALRECIVAGTFAAQYETWREALESSDTIPVPIRHRQPKRRPETLGAFRVHPHLAGGYSIAHIPSGEVMHSVIPPEEEAQTLYVEQSRLAERLQQEGDPLVIWDVGLGAAFNAMAVLRVAQQRLEQGDLRREVHLLSFEKDLDALRLVLNHPAFFTHTRHGGPPALLRTGAWTDRTGRIRWTLLEGDFQEMLETAAIPELIFFDPFSSKVDEALWTWGTFSRVMARVSGRETWLYTYSTSTPVRAGLLAAGFYVGEGVGTGPKASTTLALTEEALLRERSERGRLGTEASHKAPLRPLPLLSADWLERWKRSSKPHPRDVAGEEGDEESSRSRTMFDHAILTHPQWQLELPGQHFS